MRWRLKGLRESPSFTTVVRYSVGTATNVVGYALSWQQLGDPPPSAFVIANAWHADAEVCNGGFSQLVFNDRAVGLGTARLHAYAEAFETLGAREAAALFEEFAGWCEREKAVVERLCAGKLFGDPLTELFRGFADRYFPLSRGVRRRAIDYMLARDEPWYDAATAEADKKERLQLTLDHALDSAMVYAHLGLLRHALEVGVDLSTYRGFDGETVLHRVSREHSEAFVETLLAAGAPIDVANKRGDLPIHHVAKLNGAATRALLARGARVDQRGWHGATPLHHACPEAFALLIAAGADLHARTDDGVTLLHMAGSVEMIEMLLTAGVDPHAVAGGGRSVLHHMAPHGNREVVRRMISAGLDPDARDELGQTPLHQARESDIVEVLVEHGADVDARDAKGRTPLMTSLDSEVVAALLAHGARVDAVDTQGRTPLHHPRWHAEVIELLVAAGARLDVRDRHGRTPLEHARVARARTAAADERSAQLAYGDDDFEWVRELEEDAAYCQDAWVRGLVAASKSSRSPGEN